MKKGEKQGQNKGLPVDLSGSGGGRRMRSGAVEVLEVLVSKGEVVGGAVAGHCRSRS